MTTADERIIEVSKTKILLLIVGACAFGAIALWMFSLDSATIQSLPCRLAILISPGLAIFYAACCGIVAAFGVWKFFDSKPGLVFSPVGIVDNSGALLVEWHDVTGFGVYDLLMQKQLIVKVADPNKYIEVGNALSRDLRRNLHNMCGSPITISSQNLKISFSDLQRIADEYLRKYGKKA
jgi:uncharacterized membrane protein